MNDYSDYDDADLAALRRRSERVALEKALDMLESDVTPATARASVIRAILGDAAQRRHDDQLGDLRPDQMSAAQLNAAIRRSTLMLESIKSKNAEEVEFDVIEGPQANVFD